MKRDPWGWLLGAVGVLSIVNGIWMLIDPSHWYHELPAGVPDYGPLNLHFVRDIGCAYVTFGVAAIWAMRQPNARLPLVVVCSLFYVAHAVLHVYDTTRGFVDSHHWWLDLPGVYLPAVLLVAASVACYRQPQGEPPSS